MRNILKLKHWQLFLAIFLPSIIVELLSFSIMGFWNVIGAVWAFVLYYLWLYVSISSMSTSPLVVKWFIRCILYIAIYCVFFSLMFNGEELINFYWLIPLHILALLASFCLLYFTSKSYQLYMEKKGEKVNFSLIFVCFWFFPFGLFYMQPKLNACATEL